MHNKIIAGVAALEGIMPFNRVGFLADLRFTIKSGEGELTIFEDYFKNNFFCYSIRELKIPVKDIADMFQKEPAIKLAKFIEAAFNVYRSPRFYKKEMIESCADLNKFMKTLFACLKKKEIIDVLTEMDSQTRRNIEYFPKIKEMCRGINFEHLRYLKEEAADPTGLTALQQSNDNTQVLSVERSLLQTPGIEALKKIKAAQEAGKIGPVSLNDLLYFGLTAEERDQYFCALLSTWISLDGYSQVAVYDVMHPGALERNNNASDIINKLRPMIESRAKTAGVSVAHETYPWRTRDYEMYVLKLILDCNKGNFNDYDSLPIDLRKIPTQVATRIQYLLDLAVREKIAKLGIFDMPTGSRQPQDSPLTMVHDKSQE